MVEQSLQGVEHVAVAQIPRFCRAAVHRPVVTLRGQYHPRVALGVEEAFTILADIFETLGEQGLQLFDHCLFAGWLAEHDVSTVVGRVFLPGAQTAIALARIRRGFRVGLVEVTQHLADRAA